MSSLIEVGYLPGRLLYSVLHYNGQVWNANTNAWESYSSGNWTQYAIPLAEQTGSGYYSVAYPSQIAAGVLSTDLVYQQSGGSPALGDSIISIGQSQGVNLRNVNGSFNGVEQIGIATNTEITGTAVTGTLSTTQMTTDLDNALTDAYQGRSILWTSGQLENCSAVILNYSPTGGKLTFSPVPVAPLDGDTFIIV